MAFKFVLLAAMATVARAGIIGAPLAYSAPLATQVVSSYAAPLTRVASPLAIASPIAKAVVAEDYDHNPQYSFGYDVQDSLTGDSKSQVETRNGNVVQGSYSLNDADGTRRIVDYTADDINGFNAVVRKEPLHAKAAVVAAPTIAKIATPVTYAAPAVAKYAAPALSYAAPALRYSAPTLSYSAPALSYSAPALSYSSPALSYHAPALSYSAPLGYAAPAFTRVASPYAYSSPLSYSANLIH